MNLEFLSERPKFERLGAESKKPGRVNRTGGLYGAGLVEGVSIITQGEALGHDAWIDETFNFQVASALNASDGGVKSRFTHPSLSGDGTGKFLGRLTNARVAGDQVLGDLHLAETAHDTPDGDLAKYVMDLAEEDGKVFGLSIVFEHDEESEREFYSSNLEEFEYQDRQGEKKKGKRFKSPDERNAKNLYHVRLKELRAGDVVDDPAANPNGLFYRGQDVPIEAEKVLSFAMGLNAEKPVSQFGVDPDRLKGFFHRFLSSHGLEIVQREQNVAEPNTAPTAKPEEVRAEMLSQMAKYTAAFGADQGVKWFTEGKPLAECWEATAAALRTELAEAKKEIDTLRAKKDPARGESDPLKFSADRVPEADGRPKSVIRIVR